MRAVITGGSKGIGRAICDLLITKGFDLAICARDIGHLEKQRKLYASLYPDREVLISSVDVSEEVSVKKFGHWILQEWDSVDCLINNAGVFFPGSILEEPDDVLSKMMNTNLYSAYHLTRVLAPRMAEKKSGHIFNICSIASKIAYPNGGSYSISKFALLGFSKVLREEMKPHGVKVSSVLPGATWSTSWEGVDLPEDRLMQAHDIAIAIWSALQMSPSAVLEEIILRPQLGDL